MALRGGLSTAQLAARGHGVRVRVWVLLGVRVRDPRRMARLRGTRAGGLLGVRSRGRRGVRVPAVRW
ncbi:hypothetical protein ACGFSD_35490 [Streptomyces caniferus]|uniref:hypothetical protein n=1 Tax=Streptomyces caniferus TaxID=285557 RepID=UPI00371FCDEA